MSNPLTKSVLHIYHDCLRSAHHFAGTSQKGLKIRLLIRQEFRRHMNEEDPEKIEILKRNAAASLANYLAMQNIAKVTVKGNEENRNGSSTGTGTGTVGSNSLLDPVKAMEKERRLKELREQAEKLRMKWNHQQQQQQGNGKK